MSKGYPDFFGMPIFPQYGPLKFEGTTVECDADGWTTLFLIEGKGVVYNGFIFSTADHFDPGNMIDFRVDGESVAGYSVQQMLDYGLHKAEDHPIYLACFQTETPYYFIAIKPGITFGANLQCEFYNEYADTILVDYGVVWAELI